MNCSQLSSHTVVDTKISNTPLPNIESVKLILFKWGLLLREYYMRHHTRKQLRSLSAEQLSDIGISKEQAVLESKKPFWK